MRGFKRFDASKVTEEMKASLRATVSKDPRAALEALYQVAAAYIQPAIRAGIMPGDIVGDIFEMNPFDPGQETRYPLDFISPGTEHEYVAYTVANQGYVPHLVVEGDSVMIPTFQSTASMDMNKRYAQFARWDVFSRVIEVLESMATKKRNDDGWHVILGAGLDRNVISYDSAATAGQFTKRLVSLMKLIMRRNGGGNSTSINRFILTDLYISPEGHEDIRNWGLDQIDEVTRREIYVSRDDQITQIFQVFLHALDELGEDQEYQLFFLNELGGALQASDTELVVGLDLQTAPVFKMPVVQEAEIFPDEAHRRSKKLSWWLETEYGVGILDNRPVLLGSY